ncbi:2-hydroxy-6-oxononadienedioate/2-hydroxy-6-oxononatrienedioate hydrolase [compost metagenome]
MALPHGPGKETFISLEPRLALVTNCTRFIWGLENQVNLVAGLVPFKVIPSADHLLQSRCGHWAQWEHPQRFYDVLTSLLLYDD